eukprot:scaffold11006_cov134-Amphora_coffeaeformis.AAC.2
MFDWANVPEGTEAQHVFSLASGILPFPKIYVVQDPWDNPRTTATLHPSISWKVNPIRISLKNFGAMEQQQSSKLGVKVGYSTHSST